MSNKQTYEVCFCFRRRFRLAATEAPLPIKSLFDSHSENGIMNVDHLHRFLIDVQKQENATVDDAQTIMHNTAHIFHRKGFNLETFFKYLLGDSNPALNPDRSVYYYLNMILYLVCFKIQLHIQLQNCSLLIDWLNVLLSLKEII